VLGTNQGYTGRRSFDVALELNWLTVKNDCILFGDQCPRGFITILNEHHDKLKNLELHGFQFKGQREFLSSLKSQSPRNANP
jgi:hypothetical protein